ncbi:ATP-grasp fold amidoligase family protein [Limimaricola cinnabarinus]|uniref:ATP-grasp fold amidoligase family protein n=1 Tax=Limimaricola cinnabarinus TaxID=1125964 RepID=UPI00248FE8DA|nr:ATP-grasp fold amidoligase family protein [Limimaricola cinnabarinus]
MKHEDRPQYQAHGAEVDFRPDLNGPLPPLARWQGHPILPSILTRPHMARKNSMPTTPSFANRMDADVRQARLLETVFQEDSFSRKVRRRGWVRTWLEAHDYPTAQIQAGPFPLQELSQKLGGLDAGVIKPVQATNAWGVTPFRRTGPFSFRTLFDGEEVRMTSLLEALHAPMQRYMFPNTWQIEELLVSPDGPDTVPDDFKFYAFRGTVALILQIRRGRDGARYNFRDADWQPVFTGKYADKTDADLTAPHDPEALLGLAKSISAALPVPFCRIDLYESHRGPVVGELTPEPGGYNLFDESTDIYLGTFHEWASAELTVSAS